MPKQEPLVINKGKLNINMFENNNKQKEITKEVPKPINKGNINMFENKPKEIPKKEPLPINKGNYVNKLENNFQSSIQRNNNEPNQDNKSNKFGQARQMLMNFNPFMRPNPMLNRNINNNSNNNNEDDKEKQKIQINKAENGDIYDLYNGIQVQRKRKATRTKFQLKEDN